MKNLSELKMKDENGRVQSFNIAPLPENIAVQSEHASNLEDYIKYVDGKLEAG